MLSKTTSIVVQTPGIWCPIHLDAKKICKRMSVYKSTPPISWLRRIPFLKNRNEFYQQIKQIYIKQNTD